MSDLEFDVEDWAYFCDKLKALSGIHIKPAKYHLLQARLRKRLAANGFAAYHQYRQFLESLPSDHPEWEEFVNLLTTNKTDFFREPRHFDYLVEKILPEFLASGRDTFKVWSAACSTGEEAYTLAMILTKHLPPDRDFKILATDIDTQVLKKAENAVYPMSRLHEIPDSLHANSVAIGRGSVEGWFRIKPGIKNKIIFNHHNLMEETFPGEDVFDVILCRNVMIYFDRPAIEFVVKKLYAATRPKGYFLIGHSESIHAIKHAWTQAGPAIYKK